jgi:hypothetical protein
MAAPLTKGQKAYLAQLARRAFNMALAKARGSGNTFDGSDDPSDTLLRDEGAWRHAQVALSCGKLGLRCCSQDDYRIIEGHFLELLGQHGAAFNAQMHASTEKKRVAQFKVMEACKRFGLSIGYAAHIAKNQNNGSALEDLSERALWNLVYTINNRGRKKTQALAREMTP